MICAWFVARAVPPDEAVTGEPLSFARIANSYLPLFHDRTMVRLLLSVGLRSMCWLGAIAYLGAFITDELHLGGRAGGLVFTVSGVGNVIGSMLGGRIRFAPLTLIAGVACLGGAAAVGATFATDDRAIAIAGIIFASGLSSLAGVMTGSLLAGQTRAGAGTTMVLNGTLINFGGAAGTAISGLLLRFHGFPGLAAGLPIFAIWPVPSRFGQCPPIAS